jgi:hypothetical protein
MVLSAFWLATAPEGNVCCHPLFARLDVVLRHLPALKKGIRKIAMPAGVFNNANGMLCFFALSCWQSLGLPIE